MTSFGLEPAQLRAPGRLRRSPWARRRGQSLREQRGQPGPHGIPVAQLGAVLRSHEDKLPGHEPRAQGCQDPITLCRGKRAALPGIEDQLDTAIRGVDPLAAGPTGSAETFDEFRGGDDNSVSGPGHGVEHEIPPDAAHYSMVGHPRVVPGCRPAYPTQTEGVKHCSCALAGGEGGWGRCVALAPDPLVENVGHACRHSEGNGAIEVDEHEQILRRFEPVLRFNEGEMFFPMAVEDYLAQSALVVGSGGRRRVLAERGSLTLDSLSARGREVAGRGLSLEHVDTPMSSAQYRAWRRREDRPLFISSSRFAAVGLLSRLIDAILRVTLLLRGRVPGGFTAAAQEAYAASAGYDTPVYYGRVVEDAGYVVAQYWYFYAMNDWRSSFGGINDHEADWEQVTIFLVREGDDLRPAWVAFSSHDEVGDDLRRRWDDPDMTKVGEHPVVFAGAGSHSGAYLPGEYVVTTPFPLPEWMSGIRSAWKALRPWSKTKEPSFLSVPYIDYRRGDGVTIGAEGEWGWSPVVIDDDTPWVRDYRGLWGLDTRDPLGGERAPAGPRYERSGTVRASWGQPVAWAGLDKEPPSVAEAISQLNATRGHLEEELATVEDELGVQRDRLRGGRAAEQASGVSPRRPGTRVSRIQADVAQLRSRQAELHGILEGLDRALTAPAPPDPVHAHLSHRSLPLDRPRAGRITRIWAAASASLLLAALGVLMVVDGTSHIGILEVLGVMILVEAIIRRRPAGLVAGALVIGVGLIGVRQALAFAWDYSTDLLGIAFLVGAGALAWSTASEALSMRLKARSNSPAAKPPATVPHQ